jgi:flagellar motor switch protein FliG
VADLMNRLDVATGKRILEAIEGEDPKLALSIRNLMFTFEDLLTFRRRASANCWGRWTKRRWRRRCAAPRRS